MNSFCLELDTTPPSVQIIAPQYTSTDICTEIRITSDESLADWQEIYIIDGKGNRHDFTFIFESENELVGNISFENFSGRIAVIYCRVKDSVYNMSDLVSKTINIYEHGDISAYLKVSTTVLGPLCTIEILQTSVDIDVSHGNVLIESERI